jgi:hypothetical protein
MSQTVTLNDATIAAAPATAGSASANEPLGRPVDGALPTGGLEMFGRWFAGHTWKSKAFRSWTFRGEQ